jgi:hypothetical protein
MARVQPEQNVPAWLALTRALRQLIAAFGARRFALAERQERTRRCLCRQSCPVLFGRADDASSQCAADELVRDSTDSPQSPLFPPSAPSKSAPPRNSIPHLSSVRIIASITQLEGSRPLIHRCESEVIERDASTFPDDRETPKQKPAGREPSGGRIGIMQSAHDPHAVGDPAKGVKNLPVRSRCKPITGRDGSRHIAPTTAQTFRREPSRPSLPRFSRRRKATKRISRAQAPQG